MSDECWYEVVRNTSSLAILLGPRLSDFMVMCVLSRCFLERSIVSFSGSLMGEECLYEAGRGTSSLTLLLWHVPSGFMMVLGSYGNPEWSMVLLSGSLISDECW